MAPGPGFSLDTIANIPGIEVLSQAELRALINTANSVGVNPDHLAAIIKFESGFKPNQYNRAGSGAVGLIQFMPSTARRLGTTAEELAGMSFIQQLPYVAKYFAGWNGQLRTLDDVYLAVLYPSLIGKSDDAVFAEQGTALYDQNRGFDSEQKGFIRRSDITRTIHSVLNSSEGRTRLAVLEAPEQRQRGWLAVIGGLAVGIAYVYTSRYGAKGALAHAESDATRKLRRLRAELGV